MVSCVHGCTCALDCTNTTVGMVVPWRPMQAENSTRPCPLLVWLHECMVKYVSGTRCTIPIQWSQSLGVAIVYSLQPRQLENDPHLNTACHPL